jgi:nucleotide-binding universal stress UspA family protein
MEDKMLLKVILAPVDFSDHSKDALNEAAELAAKFGSQLVLVHVVPALPKLPTASAFFHEAEYEQELHKEAEQQLEALAQQYAGKGIAARAHVGTGNDVGMEILRIGEQEGADLIVIATHGMTGWERLAFGSVAEKVVRLAGGPVLVLRANPEAKASSPASKSNVAAVTR